MNISHKTLISIAIFGILGVAGFVLYSSNLHYAASEPSPSAQSSDTPSSTPSVSSTPELLRISDISITPPAGWYAHTLSDYKVLFTKQQELPSPSEEGTDAYPYGESVSVEVSNQEGTLEEWEEQHMINDVMTQSKTWTTWHGYKLLKTRHITPDADRISYYVFINSRVYTFSLYPADIGDPQTHEPSPNTQGIAVMEQLMESYRPHLK